MTRVDFLIAGQGLSGSLLAWQLIERGAKLLVVDAADPAAASRMAAGLINPVTGQRLVLADRCEEFLRTGQTVYEKLAQILSRPLLQPQPMLRVFGSQTERERWTKRLNEPAYADYLEPLMGPPPAAIQAPHGAGIQRRTGRLLLPDLLTGLGAWLRARGSWRQDEIAAGELCFSGGEVAWRDIRARRLLFCQGWHARHNPWFSWLPWQPVKGEILDLQMHAPQLTPWIVNAGRWLVPLPGDRFRFGASYEREPLNSQTTEPARAQLLQDLQRRLGSLPEYRVTGHQAGVRPATLDKQPFLGVHPRHPQLGICNGFGSRGSLLAPYYTARLSDWLLEDRPLPPEADLRRHLDRLPP